MGLKSYAIAPFEDGIQTDLQPFLIPEQAFEDLEDCFVWRGRIKKRFGLALLGSTQLGSRLRINLGNTDGSGNISVTVPGAVFGVGQLFSIGTEIFTVNATGTPSTLLDTGSATVKTYNTSTGALVINGASPNTACFFYPATPVMGLLSRESPVPNITQFVAFDTQFSYVYSGSTLTNGGFSRLGTVSWTGNDFSFFWGVNARGSTPDITNLYVVNYTADDHIRYIGSTQTDWTTLHPTLNAGGTTLETCLILVFFKDRLIALNTQEKTGGTTTTYVNRARYSQNGNPTDDATSWLEDQAGRGGYIDAPTKDSISTVSFVKDRLIVEFEQSTWELVYTGDATLPFRWQQLNNELGCESSFSAITFDEFVLAVGNRGITMCDGLNVKRIDEKIPDLVWGIHNQISGSSNVGPLRVYGIRDYFQEMVYWTFPEAMGNPTYPQRILAYNYRTGTFSLFNDSLTCFGYLQRIPQVTWADLGTLYGTWEAWTTAWGSPLSQAAFPFIVAGNQEGFVFLQQPGKNSLCPSLQITDINNADGQITVVNHNLPVGTYVQVSGCTGNTVLNGLTFQVARVIDANTITLDFLGTYVGTYEGGGTLERVSNISILTKQFNPGTPIGQQFSFPYIDLNLNTTSVGQISFDYLLNGISGDGVWASSEDDALLGSNVLLTSPEATLFDQSQQNYIWHRIYLQASGSMIQIQLFMADSQMRNYPVATSEITLNGMVYYAEPAGRLIGA